MIDQANMERIQRRIARLAAEGKLRAEPECQHPPSRRRTIYRGPLGCVEQCEACGAGLEPEPEEPALWFGDEPPIDQPMPEAACERLLPLCMKAKVAVDKARAAHGETM